MTNLIEILRNAPKGLKLYSPIYGEVTLSDVQPCSVYVKCESISPKEIMFDECGRKTEKGECLLFPSKENRDWNGWQKVLFKEGHFITYIGKCTLITSKVPKCGFPKEDDYLGYRFATKREIEIYNHCKNKEIVHNIEDKPFTIDDFKPFDKVLVRAIFGWKIELFAIYHKGWDTPYECLGGSCDKCVPYNDETKHLLGTTEEYNGKYKTW